MSHIHIDVENLSFSFKTAEGFTVKNLISVALVYRTDVTGLFVKISALGRITEGCVRRKNAVFTLFLFFSDVHTYLHICS